MTSDQPIHEDWYTKAFGPLYPVLYAHRTVEAAAPEAAFASAQLELNQQDQVLDLCCGNGRHMTHIAPRVAQLTGLDYSPSLLHLARHKHGQPRLIRADMRALPFQNAFTAVVNFFTSFGYFQRTEENLQVVRGIAQALKPGGRFFMDYLNPPHVIAALVPRSERDIEDLHVVERRWIDFAARRVNKNTEVFRKEACIARLSESVRLYERDELTRLLHEAGLEIDRFFGDYDGSPLEDARPRMIVVGHKG